jgi:hypothetical protein
MQHRLVVLVAERAEHDLMEPVEPTGGVTHLHGLLAAADRHDRS